MGGGVTVYLASPNTQQQAEHASGMPVLLSFGVVGSGRSGNRPWIERYQQTFRRILIDSGAYSEMNTGKAVDGAAYREWWPRWEPHADAIAGLDNINGDWRQSLRNYEQFGGFPTMHDTDPPELLDDLIEIAQCRGKWLGIGLKPPREGKERFVRHVCENVPEDIHIHGWALRGYTHVRRLDSVDSTNWYQDAMKLRTLPDTKHLTYGECLEIVVKRYQRWTRTIREDESQSLFSCVGE